MLKMRSLTIYFRVVALSFLWTNGLLCEGTEFVDNAWNYRTWPNAIQSRDRESSGKTAFLNSLVANLTIPELGIFHLRHYIQLKVISQQTYSATDASYVCR
jgi:hypothetical protein